MSQAIHLHDFFGHVHNHPDVEPLARFRVRAAVQNGRAADGDLFVFPGWLAFLSPSAASPREARDLRRWANEVGWLWRWLEAFAKRQRLRESALDMALCSPRSAFLPLADVRSCDRDGPRLRVVLDRGFEVTFAEAGCPVMRAVLGWFRPGGRPDTLEALRQHVTGGAPAAPSPRPSPAAS